MLTLPPDPGQIFDADELWVERRALVRKLIDIGDVKTAYAVARDASPPNRPACPKPPCPPSPR
jgi:soluble lytic murein transglycosylase